MMPQLEDIIAQANYHYDAGEFTQAIRMYQQALELDPTNFVAVRV